jgi:hypothetical protein
MNSLTLCIEEDMNGKINKHNKFKKSLTGKSRLSFFID